MPFAPLLISFFFTFTFTPCVRVHSGYRPHLMSDAVRRTSHIFHVSALDDLEENGPNSRLPLVHNKKKTSPTHLAQVTNTIHPILVFPSLLFFIFVLQEVSEWEKKIRKEKGQGAGDTCLYAVVYLLHSFILSCLVSPLFSTTRTKRAQNVSDTSKDNEGREGGVQVYPISSSDKQTISTLV